MVQHSLPFLPGALHHTSATASQLPCLPALDKAQENLAGAPGTSSTSLHFFSQGIPTAQWLHLLVRKASGSPEDSRGHIQC